MQKKIDNILIESKNKADNILLYSESLNDKILDVNDNNKINFDLVLSDESKISAKLLSFFESKKYIKVSIIINNKNMTDLITKKGNHFLIRSNNEVIKTISFKNTESFSFKQKENSYILKYKIKKAPYERQQQF